MSPEIVDLARELLGSLEPVEVDDSRVVLVDMLRAVVDFTAANYSDTVIAKRLIDQEEDNLNMRRHIRELVGASWCSTCRTHLCSGHPESV